MITATFVHTTLVSLYNSKILKYNTYLDVLTNILYNILVLDLSV